MHPRRASLHPRRRDMHPRRGIVFSYRRRSLETQLWRCRDRRWRHPWRAGDGCRAGRIGTLRGREIAARAGRIGSLGTGVARLNRAAIFNNAFFVSSPASRYARFLGGLWRIATMSSAACRRRSSVFTEGNVICCRINIPAVRAMKSPGWAIFRAVVNDDPCAWRIKRGLIEVKWSGEVGVSRKFWIEPCGADEIESELRLSNEPIPFAKRESWVAGREARKKVVFEGSNCTFRCVTAVHVRRGELEGDLCLEKGSSQIL